jgi:glycosyltransferase involved in cell wall biosynthesis
MHTEKPLLALDVTALLNHPVTGIQRVILELVPRVCRAAWARGLAVALVDSAGLRLRQLFRWIEPVDGPAIQAALAAISSGQVLWGPWRRCFRLARAFAAALGSSGLTSLLVRHETVRLAARHLRSFLAEYLVAKSPPLRRVDYFLGFSTGILPVSLPPGMDPDRVVLVLHDFIPLTHRQYVPPVVARGFAANLAHLACAGQPYRFLASCPHVAERIRTSFRLLGNCAVPVRLISWGYDPRTFFPDPDPGFRGALGLSPDTPLVLAVSTQDPRKRFRDIETAVGRVKAERPVHGVFIGKGPQARSRIPHVHYLGHVPDDLLRRAYSSCDVYVNWSAAEGFGLPVVEALACGARVIIPPDNETLRAVGGDHVVVAAAPTPDALAQAIAAQLSDPRPSGRAVDLAQFDWDRCCRVIQEELWGERPAARAA